MLAAVTDALGTVIDWIGMVIQAIVTPASGTGDAASPAGALYELLPLFAVGIAISALLLGIRAIKSIVWGA